IWIMIATRWFCRTASVSGLISWQGVLEFMRATFLTATVLQIVLSASFYASAQSQGQAGGGSLPTESGGAALIFRKPDNPPLHTGAGKSSGAAGGGRLSGPAKARAAEAAHERV